MCILRLKFFVYNFVIAIVQVLKLQNSYYFYLEGQLPLFICAPFLIPQSGRVNETMPDGSVEPADLPSHRPLKVYAEYDYVRQYLTDERFTVTESREEADILWLMEHFKDFK